MEDDEQGSLKESVQNLKSTLDQLTATLSLVDTKFSAQENKLNSLYHKYEALSAQNREQNRELDGLQVGGLPLITYAFFPDF